MPVPPAADTASPMGDVCALSASRKLLLVVAVLLVTLLADVIGAVRLPLGPAALVILPMLWALLIAVAVTLAGRWLPEAVRIDEGLQAWAARLLDAVLLFFIARLGLMVGHALPELRAAGWALCFQELGHAFGTLLIALPLAVLLGVKREAIGATFSIGRENTLVIIGEKYGMQSAEGRGVLAEYITGTALGALFMSLLAGLVNSLDIFDPRSLAMGAGVGSGSMMAGALGPVLAAQPPQLAPELTALAAAANLISGVAGFYFALFFSLPACCWLYDRLEPRIGRLTRFGREAARRSHEAASAFAEPQAVTAHGPLGWGDTVVAWGLMLAGVALDNRLSHGVALADTLPGMLEITALVALLALLKHCFARLPVVMTLSLLAMALAMPGLIPGGSLLAAANRVEFMSLTTPVLALAGFSAVRHLPAFRRLGWRLVLVSLTATAGTFLCATTIAECFHHF